MASLVIRDVILPPFHFCKIDEQFREATQHPTLPPFVPNFFPHRLSLSLPSNALILDIGQSYPI